MRTKLLILACAVLVAAMFGSYRAEAQEPPLDLGQTNLLVMACDYATLQAEDVGLQVRYCRRHAPEEIDGYRAKAVVKVSIIGVGLFVVTVNFQKSLWSVQTWTVGSG